MALELVIWDYNGTLTDDLSRFTAAVNVFLARHGVSPAREEEVACYDGDIPGFYSQRGIPGSPSEIAEKVFQIYAARSEPLYLRPEAIETLGKITVPQVLVTRQPTPLAEKEIGYLGIQQYFTHLFGGAQDKAALFQQLCAERRILPSEAVSIGDMIGDIRAGRHAGVKTIAVPGYHPRHILERHNPDYLVDSLPEVYECLKSNF